jgi:DtxR family Mn-dependent transcriptional regulator
MIDPASALAVAALIGLAAAVVFLPGRGLYPRWQYLHRMTERILLEDAVKHLYNYEYRNQTPTVESLSGALQIQGGRAAQLLIRLESSGLTKTAEEGPRLTQLGRENALRILRVHRLWERHLAEETGIGDGDWHREAELREHDLSPDEVDRLSEAMGDPVYDPHGDPIPTATGDIAPRQGRPLSVLHEGERATIVHIEDEPEDVYARLSEQGLYLGLPIQVTEVSDEHVRFMAEGHMIDLPPTMAGNVFVTPLSSQQEMEGPYETLHDLASRERGRVVRISPACRGLERRRLMDLGVIPGTVIEMETRSPGGDPTAYRIRGALIALRRKSSEHIMIARDVKETKEIKE